MDEVRQSIIGILSENGVCSAFGVDAFIDSMPESPDQAVALIEYGGEPTPSNAIVRRIQVLVRGMTYGQTRDRSMKAFNLLDQPSNPEHYTNAKLWWIGRAKQTPTYLKTDSQGRFYFVFNLQIVTDRR